MSFNMQVNMHPACSKFALCVTRQLEKGDLPCIPAFLIWNPETQEALQQGHLYPEAIF